VVFSGDLGRLHDAIMVAPTAITSCDYLVLESTYGDRQHDPADPLILLGQTIRKTAARGGVTVIPAFAVGRAQSLLYAIHQLKQQGLLPASLPVYLNSPMATDATALYQKHRKLHRLDHRSARPCAAPPTSSTASRNRSRSTTPDADGDHCRQRHGHRRAGAAPPEGV
jgi:metallo-beta-lactamase family protein